MEHSSPFLMSAEIIASVLFRLAVAPVRRFVRETSEAKSLANSASWLAGRAWSPLGNGQTNLNSTELQTSCDIVLALDSLEYRNGILDRFLYRNPNYAKIFKALAFLDFNVDGKNRN